MSWVMVLPSKINNIADNSLEAEKYLTFNNKFWPLNIKVYISDSTWLIQFCFDFCSFNCIDVWILRKQLIRSDDSNS